MSFIVILKSLKVWKKKLKEVGLGHFKSSFNIMVNVERVEVADKQQIH